MIATKTTFLDRACRFFGHVNPADIEIEFGPRDPETGHPLWVEFPLGSTVLIINKDCPVCCQGDKKQENSIQRKTRFRRVMDWFGKFSRAKTSRGIAAIDQSGLESHAFSTSAGKSDKGTTDKPQQQGIKARLHEQRCINKARSGKSNHQIPSAFQKRCKEIHAVGPFAGVNRPVRRTQRRRIGRNIRQIRRQNHV
ncbi:MAG: hypothetical protein JKY32_07750 [Rhizobiales bacterium]|nr:hypothetical protein [Hyphomicrobiales bacterium]